MTRSQCKVSDTQVTVKACGPLVLFGEGGGGGGEFLVKHLAAERIHQHMFLSYLFSFFYDNLKLKREI